MKKIRRGRGEKRGKVEHSGEMKNGKAQEMKRQRDNSITVEYYMLNFRHLVSQTNILTSLMQVSS